MISIKQEIMDLPAADRLDYAIDLLERLTGQADQATAVLAHRYGMTKLEARLFQVLNAQAGRLVTKPAIYAALYGDLGETDMKIIDVTVCKLRQKTDHKIETVWGQGYRMPERFVIDSPPDIVLGPPSERSYVLDKRGDRWTEDDDAELRRMAENGSDIRAIAEELNRTERGVSERLWAMRKGART